MHTLGPSFRTEGIATLDQFGRCQVCPRLQPLDMMTRLVGIGLSAALPRYSINS